MELKQLNTKMNNEREFKKRQYEREKVMKRLNEEQEKLKAYKQTKERILKKRQLSELVEHMKKDVLEQKHLEMKWSSWYNLNGMDDV